MQNFSFKFLFLFFFFFHANIYTSTNILMLWIYATLCNLLTWNCEAIAEKPQRKNVKTNHHHYQETQALLYPPPPPPPRPCNLHRRRTGRLQSKTPQHLLLSPCTPPPFSAFIDARACIYRWQTNTQYNSLWGPQRFQKDRDRPSARVSDHLQSRLGEAPNYL